MNSNPSKRKAFNFYLSYFDVYNEIDSDNEKLAFIDALLKRQFLGVEPKSLKGLAKFGYNSQKEIINKQIKGWETKTGFSLSNHDLGKGGIQPLCNPPLQQEKEEEKEKEKEEEEIPIALPKKATIDFKVLLDFINKTTGREFKVINQSVKAKFNARLKDGYSKEDISNTITNCVKDKFHKESNFKYLTPEYFSRAATLDKFTDIHNKPKIIIPPRKKIQYS